MIFKRNILFLLLLTYFSIDISAQHSIAREWNEVLLEAIRKDYARPTVHARNLFHSSVIMYDSWAVFDDTASTVFLGKNFNDYNCGFNGIATPSNKEEATNEIISYAMYKLLNHRFKYSPNSNETLENIENLFIEKGYNTDFNELNYNNSSKPYAALGNYLATRIIEYGLQDGANENGLYGNLYYSPVNDPLILSLYLDNSDIDPNRWQPLAFNLYIDQSGNAFPINTPSFLSPEWGKVKSFCLQENDLQILNNGFDSYIYNDPGPPVYIQESNENGIDDPYKWHFALVIAWSAHLSPDDETLMDISPGGIGNIPLTQFPTTFEEYKNFYKFIEGGDIGEGHFFNPITGQKYKQNIVKRADYARVLAEFWADGPDSETPPGHWFTILNYVSDHPQLTKQIGGTGDVVSDLEWDVKSYLTLGGAMHDAAINTWGIKGYYDYIRPISAIRYMASKGQSSNASLASYDPHGLPLIDGLIEIINTGDDLAGDNNENVGQIKVMSWKGPDYIDNPDTDAAGVGWILGTKWWPYQRPSFVTPPFAGYLSGHSTFSRAASEVLTQFTGSAFFPGGMGTFDVIENEFLVFEEGPTQSFQLQWATYYDASDQTSLSRIWGGIHPPIDDIKGRIIGDKIGRETFSMAQKYFSNTLSNENFEANNLTDNLYPVPLKNKLNLKLNYTGEVNFKLFSFDGKEIINLKTPVHSSNIKTIDLPTLSNGIYFVKVFDESNRLLLLKKVIK